MTNEIPSITAKQLGSDEMDDLGDKLFNYEKATHHNEKNWYIGNEQFAKGNAVFVRKDMDSNIVAAEIQGTNTFMYLSSRITLA